MSGIFDSGLDRNPANFRPLTPISFLERAARVFPELEAVIHGESRLSYAELWGESKRLASALSKRGIGLGDTVSVMLSNTPPMVIAHFGVPMTGAVLHSINTRLDPETIAYQLDHGEAKVLIVDREFADVAKRAVTLAEVDPLVIDYDDPEYPDEAPASKKDPFGSLDFPSLLDEGNADYEWEPPKDEWQAISLNYTSGTTGRPKGVVYSHRSAALMGYNNTIHAALGQHNIYLWTLPMFHCNGWCFPWTLALTGSTHVCLRWVRAGAIWDALHRHRVTHLCGAPIVMSTILDATEDEKRTLEQRVNFNVAAAPPPESVLRKMDEAGFTITHVYGLTESYGPAVVNVWKEEWDHLESGERAKMKARQGVPYCGLDGLDVRDPETMEQVPADGETMGEVMMRGNIVMKGYLKNDKASEEAFRGGWFHTGDLAVMHPDGYIQIMDRSKDIIISGGENISSIEVENAIYRHPDVTAVAVVAEPHEKWGETPAAYIETRKGATLTKEDIIAHCKKMLAGFQRPGSVYFEELPKTSTGKIEKFRLRQKSKERVRG